MNDKLVTLGKTHHLTCAWVSTGDAKTPLACVWVDAETSRTAPSAQTASNDESGGDASVRLETGELQPRALPGLRGRPPLRGEVAQLEDAPHLAGTCPNGRHFIQWSTCNLGFPPTLSVDLDVVLTE